MTSMVPLQASMIMTISILLWLAIVSFIEMIRAAFQIMMKG